MMPNITDKKELRRYFSKIRAAASDDAKNRAITEKVFAHPKINSADTVLLYASYKSEVSTWDIAEKLLKKGIKTAFPICGEKGKMTFHIIDTTDQLVPASYGIREPDSSLPQPVFTDRTVCIVPGLAFTEKGERLGYGGGFYDRFLGEHPMIFTIALAFEDCITDNLTTESHDIKINTIITEERMVLCNE